MPHLVAFACGLAVTLAVAFGVDALAGASHGAGQVWVVTRGDGAARVLGGEGVQLVRAWGGGRVLLLQAPTLSAVRWPSGGTWLTLRLPSGAFALPGCG